MANDYVVVNANAQALPNAGFTELLVAVLARGAPFRFQASGYSMSPFIRNGDVLTLGATPRRLHLGEVVAFINPCNARLSVHRIVQTGPNGYLLRGDNTPEPDGTVAHSDILGRVIRLERCGRRVRLGLGPERVMIVFLSRCGWLIPLLVPVWNIYHNFFKRAVP
jgi:hypothetical protein